jgi:hypothetical protein
VSEQGDAKARAPADVLFCNFFVCLSSGVGPRAAFRMYASGDRFYPKITELMLALSEFLELHGIHLEDLARNDEHWTRRLGVRLDRSI